MLAEKLAKKLMDEYHADQIAAEEVEQRLTAMVSPTELAKEFIGMIDQRDTFLDLLNKIWRDMYPNSHIGWEYPGQIVAHARADRLHVATFVEGFIQIASFFLNPGSLNGIDPTIVANSIEEAQLNGIKSIIYQVLSSSHVIANDGATLDLNQIQRFSPNHQPIEGVNYVKR